MCMFKYNSNRFMCIKPYCSESPINENPQEFLTKKQLENTSLCGKFFDNTKLMYKELYRSPLFHLSLANKELYHSNFIAWLGDDDETKPLFIEIIKNLSNIDLSGKDFVVKREYKNYDLSILFKDNPNPVLVLENKNKSIPSKDQLDKYLEKEKNNQDVKYVLLSLATEFPKKDEITKSWKLVSYACLACFLKDHIDLVKNGYKKQLIEDYISFISLLHKLSQSWLQQTKFFMPVDEWDLLKKCRIHDLCDKIRAANMVVNYNKKYQSKIEWFYSNGSAALAWNRPIDAQHEICIQIQGGCYRHAIVEIKKKSGKTNDIEEINEKGKELTNLSPIQGSEFLKLSQTDDAFFNNNDSIFEDQCCYPIDKPKQEKLFNKFEGKNKNGVYLMVYQYRKIKKDITCKQLFEFLNRDIQKIEELLSIKRNTQP